MPFVERPVPSVRRGGVAAALLTLGLLGGCTSTEAPPEDAQRSGTEVIQPGRPGEEASAIDPGSVTVADPWNHADVAFMQMMIPHHAQALEMSRLAADRASSPQVRSLAERIEAAQGPEIMLMAAWLEERKMEVPRAADEPASYDHAQHGHDGMAGMLTRAEMNRLSKASGEAFDRLFLEGMIGHHEGALEMADNVAGSGEDLRVSELATDVSVGQAGEITRMEELLAAL